VKALEKERTKQEAADRHRRSVANDPRYNRILDQFPDTGLFRRELYPKHMEFFAAGATHMERCFMAANRVGKTRAGACEMTYHLTGLYPPWWTGKRFDHPIDAWACGSTGQTVRDTVQAELLGKVGPDKNPRPEDRIGLGTGMIPLRYILKVRPQAGGVADAIDRAFIQHVSGGTSILGFKSYSQGRKSFEGTGQAKVSRQRPPPARTTRRSRPHPPPPLIGIRARGVRAPAFLRSGNESLAVRRAREARLLLAFAQTRGLALQIHADRSSRRAGLREE
jgi:hypothetical protein